MKVVFLNTWNGKMRAEIEPFIREQSQDADIFCLQEVYPEMRALCQQWLSDYQEFYAYKFIVKDDDFPQATYVRKSMPGLESEIVLENEPNCGLGINVRFQTKNGILNVCNFHGAAFPGDKLDNPNRLKQSERLIDFFRQRDGQKIIGGDFNLLNNTQSVRMFSENGYADLIHDFEIKTTRNRLAWEMYPDSKQFYSDFVFVSPEVKIEQFMVPENEISDHLPIIMEIEINKA
ncbi:hypothetical protein EPO05_04410 [Patescibacteria group bacterium]|nr:MAG: hypothetical protein EPO05_04410 [Patescibacteria group bacterium]